MTPDEELIEELMDMAARGEMEGHELTRRLKEIEHDRRSPDTN